MPTRLGYGGVVFLIVLKLGESGYHHDLVRVSTRRFHLETELTTAPDLPGKKPQREVNLNSEPETSVSTVCNQDNQSPANDLIDMPSAHRTNNNPIHDTRSCSPATRLALPNPRKCPRSLTQFLNPPLVGPTTKAPCPASTPFAHLHLRNSL